MRRRRHLSALAVLLARAAAGLVLLAPCMRPALSEEPIREFERACGLAASGELDLALDAFSSIAESNPAWIAAHHALASTALSAGGDAAAGTRTRLRTRVRRSSRDVGAAVGLALFLESEGDRREAHRLILSAILTGARDPVLPPLLVRTTADEAGLVRWMRERSSVLPGDTAFAGMRAAVLAELGFMDDALSAADAAIARAPSNPWLNALRTDLLRIAGREAEACASADLGEGRILARAAIAQERIPRRAALARAFTACGRFDDAERVIAGHGPLLAAPGLAEPAALVRAVQAELLLARGRPVEALARLDASGQPEDRDAAEIAAAVRLRAAVALGTIGADERAVLDRPLPSGAPLADRATAIAALSAADADPRLAASARGLASLLGDAGLEVRSRRLALVAAWAARERPERSTAAGAELAVAEALVDAGVALSAGDAEEARGRAALGALETAGAPGTVVAALRVLAARAALAAGDHAAARDAARDGLLDLQEADRTGAHPSPEIERLVASVLEGRDAAVLLAGLGFRAARADGVPLDDAADALLEDLDRAVRGWSMQPWGWPRRIADLEAARPSGSCLVISTGAGGDDALALGDGERRVGSTATIVTEPPCGSAATIFWLGPHGARGGLTPAGDPTRVLVRIAGAGPAEPSRSEARPRPTVLVGPGTATPLSRTVVGLAGLDEEDEVVKPPLVRRSASHWEIWTGAGLAIASRPLASGWLVPSDPENEATWIGPDAIASLSSRPGEGLVATGLRSYPGLGPDRGSWVLAEAAFAARRPWALLSREPLSPDDAGRLAKRLPRIAHQPARGLRELVRDEPRLAERLTLWSHPGAWRDERGPFPWLAAIGLALALALTAAVLFGMRRRGRRALNRPAR